MKHDLKMKKRNQTQRKRNKSKWKSRSKSRRRMHGGEPEPIITFSTSNGRNYKIAKDPMVLLHVLTNMNDESFKAGIGVQGHVKYEIEISNYKPIIDKTRDVMDFSHELFGMYFLYGQNSSAPPYPEYGLFYLLKRIQLLAVLYKIKTMPNTKFPTLDVSLPINKDSILPAGYDRVPHGYLFQCTKDTTDSNFDEFIKFVQQMNKINELPLPLTQDNINELEIPSFLKLTRMSNSPKIKIFDEIPIVTGWQQTKMNELDGGRRRTNRTFNKIRRVCH